MKKNYLTLKNLVSLTQKEVEDNIHEQDISTYLTFLTKAGKYYEENKVIRVFNSTSKILGLYFLMQSFYSKALITKTDFAKSMSLLSRDGALKFINSLITMKLVSIYKTDSDARKQYVIPEKILMEEFNNHMKKRLAKAHMDLVKIQESILKRVKS